MSSIEQNINILSEINSRNSIDNDKLNSLLEKKRVEKVCVPIIGKFSAGKSALINMLLAYSNKILKEDITPETAVATELVYGENEQVLIKYFDNTSEIKNFDDYRSGNYSTENVQSIRITLKNNFLETISNVMIVDMPGFDSGYIAHDKVIDNYLPKSLAYIITFPADDMTLKSNIEAVIREITTYKVPIYIIITKIDKVDEQTLKDNTKHLQERLAKFMGYNFEIAYTSCLGGNSEKAINIFNEIEIKSSELIDEKYYKIFLNHLSYTENYITSIKESLNLSQSELLEKEESIIDSLKNLSNDFEDKSRDFKKKLTNCVEEIKCDVHSSLNSSESTLVTMALNNENIESRINQIIRQALTASISQNYTPLIEEYIKDMEDMITSNTNVIVGSLSASNNSSDGDDLTKGLGLGIGATGAIGGLALVAIGVPVIGAVVGAIALVVGGIISLFSNSNDTKRDEAKRQIRNKLQGEVFPNALNQVESNLQQQFGEQLDIINAKIKEKIEENREIFTKSLEDVRQKIDEEQSQKDDIIQKCNYDLELIGGMKNE